MKVELVYMRIVAMLMVVLGHSLCPLAHIWHGFDSFIPLYGIVVRYMNCILMPVFFFIFALLSYELSSIIGNSRLSFLVK